LPVYFFEGVKVRKLREIKYGKNDVFEGEFEDA